MKSKIDGINESWKIPHLLISLPAKPIITPLLKEMKENQMNRYMAKEITRDQYRSQGFMIDYSIIFLNSLSVGLLISIMLKIFNHYRSQK